MTVKSILLATEADCEVNIYVVNTDSTERQLGIADPWIHLEELDSVMLEASATISVEDDCLNLSIYDV